MLNETLNINKNISQHIHNKSSHVKGKVGSDKTNHDFKMDLTGKYLTLGQQLFSSLSFTSETTQI